MTRHLLDSAPCGYFAFSDDGIIKYVNQTLADLLKRDTNELIGNNVESIFTLATRIFFQTHFFPLIKLQGFAEEIFISILGSDGQHLPVLLNARRVNFIDQTLTSCAFIVVPNRKKFEDELLLAKRLAEKALAENTALMQAKADLGLQAEQLDRQMQNVSRQNNELKQFSHVITHSLKEPLRKILLFTGKLNDEVSSPTMSKLLRSADQMRAVITGLQQYVWLNEKVNEFSQVDLNDIVVKASAQLFDEIDPKLLSVSYQNLHTLEGDADQLRLLFYHVLLNAVRFRKGDASSVTITSTVLKQNKFRSIEDRYKYENYLRLVIEDNGIGFDPKYKEHVFELFRKLDVTGGQGVGLALCRKIADNHHGFAEAESEINMFTRIIVWLPLSQ